MHDTVWREPLDTSAPRGKKLKIKKSQRTSKWRGGKEA